MGDAGHRPDHRRNLVFVGLVLGMLVAVTNQTVVSPAMPLIVAELGGIEHYGWIASSALLAAAVAVPVVGKLSDLYGRRGFYVAGLVVLVLGSVLAGLAPGFWWLVAARAVQGLGMGAVQTLSLTVLGEIVSPRERGRYMGYLGAVFGVALGAGPLAGGWIADSLSWRWLFYANLPLALAALAFVAAFLRPPGQPPRGGSLDYVGFVTLGLGLCSVLLAATWGGALYPWGSWQVLSLCAASAALLAGFAINEGRAEDPVLPPRLWRQPVFVLAGVSNVAVSMVMFGAVFFVPLYAQGVMGVGAGSSGAVLVPLLLSAVTTSIVVGRLITRTGRYKAFVLAGLLVLMAGYALLARLGPAAPARADLTVASVVVGLGAVLQTYTLIVQNAASRADLGVVTSVSQLARSAGAAFGPAVFGAVMTARMETEIPRHLPPGASGGSWAERLSGGVGSLLDPGAVGTLPPAVAAGVREGLAAAMHSVFLTGLSIVAVALVASAFIRELPLRDTAYVDEDPDVEDPADVLHEEPAESAAEGAGRPVRRGERSRP